MMGVLALRGIAGTLYTLMLLLPYLTGNSFWLVSLPFHSHLFHTGRGIGLVDDGLEEADNVVKPAARFD